MRLATELGFSGARRIAQHHLGSTTDHGPISTLLDICDYVMPTTPWCNAAFDGTAGWSPAAGLCDTLLFVQDLGAWTRDRFWRLIKAAQQELTGSAGRTVCRGGRDGSSDFQR
jgi:hypothetical protein